MPLKHFEWKSVDKTLIYTLSHKIKSVSFCYGQTCQMLHSLLCPSHTECRSSQSIWICRKQEGWIMSAEHVRGKIMTNIMVIEILLRFQIWVIGEANSGDFNFLHTCAFFILSQTQFYLSALLLILLGANKYPGSPA